MTWKVTAFENQIQRSQIDDAPVNFAGAIFDSASACDSCDFASWASFFEWLEFLLRFRPPEFLDSRVLESACLGGSSDLRSGRWKLWKSKCTGCDGPRMSTSPWIEINRACKQHSHHFPPNSNNLELPSLRFWTIFPPISLCFKKRPNSEWIWIKRWVWKDLGQGNWENGQKKDTSC